MNAQGLSTDTRPAILPTLLVLAAGMGSRYGGLKQLDPIGPQGETMLDYAAVSYTHLDVYKRQALGHPLGATGAIRAATVIHALQRKQLKYGMVSMCIGMGQGAAGIFERV